MAVKFKDTININGQYTLPEEDGVAGQVMITDGAGVLTFGDGGGNLVFYEVKNSTGSTIAKGTAVRVVGTDGNSGHKLIAPMVANGTVEPKYYIGVTYESITNGSIGKVIHFGEIDQVNTLAFNDGDVLWCDPANNGGFTTTEPNAPNVKLATAIVINSATNGKIFVRVQGNEGLHELHDVYTQSLVEGDILIYDGTNTYWKNSSQSNTAALMPSGTDAERPTPESGMIRFNTTAGEFEGYNGTEWAPIGGANTASIDIDNFTGDGTTVNFTLTSDIQEEDNTQVYIDGVYQSKSNYTTSGTTLTFSTAPPNGTSIEVVNFTGIAESQVDGSGTANYVTKWQDADTLANSIIYDNGTNVGIGTTSPGAKLDVDGNIIAGGANSIISGTGLFTNSTIQLHNGTAAANNIDRMADVVLANNTSYTDGILGRIVAVNSSLSSGEKRNAQISFNNDGATNSGLIHFATSNAGTFETKMTIKGNGNVGIGTSTPSANLEVSSDNILGSFATIRLNAPYYQYWDIKNDSGLSFIRGTLEHLRIDSSGNVGIGSTNPVGKFEVNTGSSAAYFTRTAGDNGGTAPAFGILTDASLTRLYSWGTGMTFWTGAVGGTASERMRIDSSGMVGIGTSGEAYDADMLNVKGTNKNLSLTASAGGNVAIYTSDSQAADIGGSLAFGGVYTGITPYTFGAIAGRKSNSTAGNAEGYLAFYTTSSSNTVTERMRITSGGAIHLSQGTGNSYIGTSAGNLGTSTGTYNTGFGSNSLASLTSGNYNTAIGQESLLNNTTGSYNTAAGRDALALNTTGNYNTSTGYGAMLANTTGAENTAVGYLSLTANTTGSYNTAVGLNSLRSNSTGNNNVAIGLNALLNNTTGNYNTANGTAALNSNTTGSNNAAFGGEALLNNTTGYQNTALGTSALAYNTTGYQNTAVGASALAYNTTGYSNTAIGLDSLFSNTTGYYNTANGYNSLYYNTTGYSNTAIGLSSLYYNTTGNSNTALGVQGLLYNTTGTQNTSIGLNSGLNITTGSNNSFLGYNAQPSSGTVSNEITLGDANVTSLRCNTQTISSLSDARDKTNVEDLPLGLDFVDALRPVKFDWDRRDGTMSGVKDAGFIAQELDEAQSQYGCEDYLGLVYKNNPEKLEASYGKLVPVLVKAIQELKAEVESLKQQIS